LSKKKSILLIGMSPPVLWYTNTRFTQGLAFTAPSTTFFSSIILPPLTPWSAVITVSAWAKIQKQQMTISLRCNISRTLFDYNKKEKEVIK